MSEPQKVAVITGAAQGIGRRTAQLFAEQGYRLALADLRSLAASTRAAQDHGTEILEFTGDISNEQTVTEFTELVKKKWGRVDVLVNNAGISFISPAESVSAADFRRVLEVNLLAPFLLAKSFGSIMLSQGSGSIVNVASVAGLLGVAYNSSKHGLVGLTRTLATEWGGRGVRVNAVCPGWVKTEMDTADQAGGGYSDVDITNRVPMARFASPEDIANAIGFLADERSSAYINGHMLSVDGGWSADGSWETLRLRHR
jgi:NAD(P)-dependent dehydrogenase (short-subunit alcohol dehydrogenase family)